jgi:hypothetical protein
MLDDISLRKNVFRFYYELGYQVRIVCNKDHPDIVLPDDTKIAVDNYVVLDYCSSFVNPPIADLILDELGISAKLSINQKTSKVYVPWVVIAHTIVFPQGRPDSSIFSAIWTHWVGTSEEAKTPEKKPALRLV